MKNIEKFSIGGTTNINMDVNNQRSLEQSLDVTTTQTTNCVTNFVNKIKNNIKINSETASNFSATARNNIVIQNISGCDTINIGDIKQVTDVRVTLNNSLMNEKRIAIETSVNNSVTTVIERNQDMNQLLEQTTNAQRQAMESFLKGSEIDYDALGRMAAKAAGGGAGAGIGNTKNVNIDFDQQTDVGTALGITSAQINDVTSGSTNDIASAIESTTDTQINTALNAENIIKISQISNCDSLNINDVQQNARINADISNLVRDTIEVEMITQFKNNVDNLFRDCWAGLQGKNSQAGFDAHNRGRSSDNYVTQEEYAAGLDAIANNLESVELGLYLAMLDEQDPNGPDTGDLRQKIVNRLNAIAAGDTTGCRGTTKGGSLDSGTGTSSSQCLSAAERERILGLAEGSLGGSEGGSGGGSGGGTGGGKGGSGGGKGGSGGTKGGSKSDKKGGGSKVIMYVVISIVVIIIIYIAMTSFQGSDEYDYDYYNKYLSVLKNSK